MRNAKKLLILLLSLVMIFTLFSCGECKHADENADGLCDKCGEETEVTVKSLKLIENGIANFQFVIGAGTPVDAIRKIDETIEILEDDYEIEVKRVTDKSDNIQDVEVLIGDVTTRGEKYQYDKHNLGKNGYVITIVDSKVVINAGSEKLLTTAVNEFIDEILGLEDDPDELWDVKMTTAQIVEEIQSDYKITGLTINGTDIKGYTIAYDDQHQKYIDVARDLQRLLYEKAGYWLEIVTLDKADKSIIIKHVDKDETAESIPDGFRISANSNNQLLVECAFDNMLIDSMLKFTQEKLEKATGAVDFTGAVFTNQIRVLYYEDFGAKGDGKTNDFAALYKTHELANQSGQLVKATAGNTYYISDPIVNGTRTSIPVKTNVDWQGAEFIIDDSTINNTTTADWNVPIFKVTPNDNMIEITPSSKGGSTIINAIKAAGLNKNTKKIDLGPDYKCNVMLIPINSSHTIYRRLGYSAYDGTSMREVIILDEEGNVSADTPVAHDYCNITSLRIYKLDTIEPITLENGTFTNIAPQFNCIGEDEDGGLDITSNYIYRGILVSRSFTTVKNVKHYMKGEADWSKYVNGKNEIQFVGSCYKGFYRTEACTNVTYENCVITAKKAYRRPSGGTGGTYDIGIDISNKVVFKNCTQSNFWVTLDENYNIIAATEDTPGAMVSMDYYPEQVIKAGGGGGAAWAQMHWGCGGSNLCKNIEYINSTLSRFDAHEGMHNGRIEGSTLSGIAITGGGKMVIKDSKIYPASDANAVSLREDYGCTWDGVIEITNLEAYVNLYTKAGARRDVSLVRRDEFENWYFGEVVAVPNLIVKDVMFYDVNTRDAETGEYEAVSSTEPIYLYGTIIIQEDYSHLDTLTKDFVDIKVSGSGKSTGARRPKYSIEDVDGDGYLDEPDLDEDGVFGNTSFKYDEVTAGMSRSKMQNGWQDMNSLRNLNKIRPPEYVKILSNKGGYTYYVPNTGMNGNISNGGYYGITNNKGFYGSTKFYYGTGANGAGETYWYVGPVDSAENNSNLYKFY